jgi:spermidine synthase
MCERSVAEYGNDDSRQEVRCNDCRVRPAAAAIVVSLAAGAVLLLEILAVRLMAPYVGVSLNTYTGIIGTVLAGISAGAWVGGWAADRFEPGQLVGALLIAGGVLALATAPLVTELGKAVQSDTLKAIVFLSAATVFLPAFVLSAVHPVVVKMQLQSLDVTGSVVGRLSACATAGALVGTFGTGFFLTAHFPTRAILAGVGAVLIAIGALTWWRLGRRAKPVGVIALAIATIGAGSAAATVDGPCKVESAYACIRVVDIGGGYRKLMLDSVTNAVVRLDRPQELTVYNILFGAALDSLREPGAPIRALHIGGGGFTVPRYIAATRPGSANTVMEIDPAVVDTARNDFGLRSDPSLQIQEGDARLLIGDERSDSYDAVIGDAFSGLTVPWQLTTKEFLEEVRRVLKPRGVYMMNLIDPGMAFVKAEAATLREMFDYVGLFYLGGNRILVAADWPIVEPMYAQLEDYVPPVSGDDLDRLIGGARILEDDFAPVDQLLRE